MGLSLYDQIDMSKYFSLSTISIEKMKAHNITLSVEELKALARDRVPAGIVETGSTKYPEKRRFTKFWEYDDFSNDVSKKPS